MVPSEGRRRPTLRRAAGVGLAGNDRGASLYAVRARAGEEDRGAGEHQRIDTRNGAPGM
jgi:hypothetical protein